MTELVIHTEDLMMFKDVATLLGVSRPTIYNYIERHRLHPVEIGVNRYLLTNEVNNLKRELDELQSKANGKAPPELNV